MSEQLTCGAARREITPTVANGILPMPRGFSASTRELTEAHDPLYVRVIALSYGEKRVLLVSMDVVNLDAKRYGPVLAAHTGVPEEGIFLLETTAHSTIRAGTEGRNGTDPIGLEKLARYADLVEKQLLAAADEALASLKPAKIGVGRGESYINTNRYMSYTVEENGRKESYCNIGPNFAGPSDHSVNVLRLEGEDGTPIAFFINYAIFCVLMDDNMAGENGTGAVSADLAGYISTHVEDRYPGAVAMWCGGANCDQNPILGAKYFVPDPDHGGKQTKYLSREACGEVLAYLGGINYADTLRAIESIGQMREAQGLAYARGETGIPGREQTVERTEDSSFVIRRYSDGPEKRLHLSVLRIGDVALVFHGGSMFSSVGLRMKEDSIAEDTFINTGFVHSQVPFDGVICDDASLALGGHDPDRAKYRPGFVTSALTVLMNRLIMETEEKPWKSAVLSWEKDLG